MRPPVLTDIFDTHFCQSGLHFNITELVTRDHLSCSFLWGGLARQVLQYPCGVSL